MNISPPRSKMPQVSGRSPSPSVNVAQRLQEYGSPHAKSHHHHLSQQFTRSPSPAIGSSILGKNPSPAASGTSPQATTSTQGSEQAPPPPKRKQMFHRELKYMMHGFGDDPSPYSQSVELLEELVIQFITKITLKRWARVGVSMSMTSSSSSGRTRRSIPESRTC